MHFGNVVVSVNEGKRGGCSFFKCVNSIANIPCFNDLLFQVKNN